MLILEIVFVIILVAGCAQQNKDGILTIEDIKSELQNLEQVNQLPGKDINPNDYPKIIGIDERNNKRLEETYFCMDICPDYANVLLIYEEVNSESECGIIGGETLFTGEPAPGRFIGCKPKVE